MTRAKPTARESYAAMQARRGTQRVNVDFPVAFLRDIDAEAARLCITRQAFIKLRMADAINAVRRDAPR